MNRRGARCLAAFALLIAVGLPRLGPVRARPVMPSTTGSVIYAGLQDGYIYKSTDGGTDWQEADNGLPPDTNVTALAVTPDGGKVFAGMGGDGSGVYVSTDGGLNWRDDNDDNLDIDTENAHISGLALNPKQRQSIYAVTIDGTFYAGTGGGDHWTGSLLPTNSIITSLAVSRQNPALLLIGTQGGGILRSADDGADWENTGLSTAINVQAVSFSPKGVNVAYAATDTGIYQTIDGGASWQPDQRGIPAGMSFQSIAIDPSDPARVIAGGSFGDLYRSQDGGTSWTYQGQAGNDQVHAILFDPSHRGVVLVGTEDGGTLYRSDDGGGHWFGFPTDFAPGEGILTMAATASPALPTDPVAAPSASVQGMRYFPQTHHTVSGKFLAFYNANNGLKIFGLPLTEPFVDRGQTVQYFERSRLVSTDGRISLTPLGAQLTAGRRFRSVGCCPPSGQVWFKQTKHTLSGTFLSFWRRHNGPMLFGFPISQPLYEQNGDGTGRTYLVQYFQNARMEYHPELAGTGNAVTLGLLGKEALQQRGWL